MILCARVRARMCIFTHMEVLNLYAARWFQCDARVSMATRRIENLLRMCSFNGSSAHCPILTAYPHPPPPPPDSSLLQAGKIARLTVFVERGDGIEDVSATLFPRRRSDGAAASSMVAASYSSSARSLRVNEKGTYLSIDLVRNIVAQSIAAWLLYKTMTPKR